LIANKEYKSLYLHNLVYPYGVARKYFIHWIPKEELIDESIIGFKKGLDKYLEAEREFRIGEYVIWWCQRSCIEKVIRDVWQLSQEYEERSIPKSEMEKIISKIQNGKEGQSQFLKEHYSYLFEAIDEKYISTEILLTEELKDKVIERAVNKDFSLDGLKDEQYEKHRNELEFEDILILEYSLCYEKEYGC